MEAGDSNGVTTRRYCSSIISEIGQASVLSAGTLTDSLDDSHSDENTDESLDSQDDDDQSREATSSATQAAKAVDIAEETDSWDPRTPSRLASLASTSSEDLYGVDDRRPFLSAPTPPPDYDQATAQQGSFPWGAGSNGGITNGDEDEDLPLELVSRRSSKRRRWSWKAIVLSGLGLYCTIATVLLFLRPKHKHIELAKQDPIYPDHPYRNFGKPEVFHQSTSRCHFNSYTPFLDFGWLDLDSFSFNDTVQESDYWQFGNVTVSGRIEIRPAPYIQRSAIHMIVNYATTSTWRAPVPQWHFESDTFRLYTSLSSYAFPSVAEHKELKRGISSEAECLDIFVGMYVKVPMNEFTVQTESSNIDIGQPASFSFKEWSFRIRNESLIHTKRGNVTVGYWDSRNAQFRTDRGSISGTFGLNDHLSIETKEGDITVELVHQPALEEEYLDTHPPKTPANLSTFTGSGDQEVTIMQPPGNLNRTTIPGLEYKYLLNSSHYSEYGSVKVQIGEQWEGEVHASSVNGSIELAGEELEEIPAPVDGGSDQTNVNHAWAKKGGHPGLTTIEAPRGNISLCVRDKYPAY